MAKVDAKLYELLKDCETGLYETKEKVIAFAHIPFYQVKDFTDIVGQYWFEDGGLDCKLFSDTICIELNDIFEADDNSILDYENCFDKHDLDCYRKYMIN